MFSWLVTGVEHVPEPLEKKYRWNIGGDAELPATGSKLDSLDFFYFFHGSECTLFNRPHVFCIYKFSLVFWF